MQERSELNSPQTGRSPRFPGGHPGRESLDGMTAVDYWLLFRPWFRQIALVTVLAVVCTAILRKTLFTQWYQAEAVVRPASQEGPTSPLAMLFSQSPIESAFSSLMSAAGISEQTPSDAADEMAIMNSYDFTIELVKRHNLVPIITRPSLLRWLISPLVNLVTAAINWVQSLFGVSGPQGPDEWLWYQAMQDRFNSDFDYKEGNLTVSFIDPDPDTAKQILGFYLSDLRAKLRGRAINESRNAVAALRDEIGATSDPTIELQLATLLAQEIQQEKTAEVQADFAFTMIQMPAVPDYVYRPNLLLECSIVFVLVPLFYFIGIMFYTRVYLPAQAIQEASSAPPIEARPSSVAAHSEPAEGRPARRVGT
jgi:hypothetical protein